MCAATTLLFLAIENPLLWMALRFVTGLGLAGLFSVVEGWLAAATASESRGRIIGFYLVATKVSTVLGQLLTGLGVWSTASLFTLAAGAFSIALIPVALTPTPAPSRPRTVSLELGTLWRIAPAAVVGCASAGLLNSAVGGLLPVWGAGLAMPTGLIVTLLSMMQLGSLVLQWPLGWLSDRIDRRQVILACAVAVVCLSVAIAVLGTTAGWLLLGLFLLWGAFSMSVYGVCVAHAADHARLDQMVGVSSGGLFAWASGTATGPILAAPLLQWLGPPGLFIYATIVGVGLAAFTGWRMTRRAPVPVEAREAFVNLPATSPRLAEIDPRGTGLRQ
jgi:MFS family permease